MKPKFPASSLGLICDSDLYRDQSKLSILLTKYFPCLTLKNQITSKQPTTHLTPTHRVKLELLLKHGELNMDMSKLKFDDSSAIRSYLRCMFPCYNETFIENETQLFKARYPKAYQRLTMYRGIKLEKYVFSYVVNLYAHWHMFEFVKHGKILKFDNGSFEVVGKVDGLDKSRATLLEIKTRSNLESESEIPLKDRVQVMFYMRMLNLRYCVLVECGPNGKESIRTRMIKYDKDECDEYVDRVAKFTQFANSMAS